MHRAEVFVLLRLISVLGIINAPLPPLILEGEVLTQ